MDSKEPPHTGDKIRLLRGQYLVQLSERIKTIDIIRHACTGPTISKEIQERLANLVHGIAGSAGTYGFAEISQEAMRINQYLVEAEDVAPAELANKLGSLSALCKTITQRALDAPAQESANVEESNKSLKPKDKLIAIIDDDPIILLAYQAILGDRYNLALGVNATQAHQIMKQRNPDLVLLDDIMPGGATGLSFLESIKNDNELCKIPVIMVTASNAQQDVIRGYAAGSIEYITKPFQAEGLLDVVYAVLSRKPAQIFIGLEDAALSASLKSRLIELQCRVSMCESEAPSISGHYDVVILDEEMAAQVNIQAIAQYKDVFAYLVVGARSAQQAGGEGSGAIFYMPSMDIHDIVRRTGLILSDIRKQKSNRFSRGQK